MMLQFKVIGCRLCVVDPNPDRQWDYFWGFYRVVEELT
jgi:hypothetical protein